MYGAQPTSQPHTMATTIFHCIRSFSWFAVAAVGAFKLSEFYISFKLAYNIQLWRSSHFISSTHFYETESHAE